MPGPRGREICKTGIRKCRSEASMPRFDPRKRSKTVNCGPPRGQIGAIAVVGTFNPFRSGSRQNGKPSIFRPLWRPRPAVRAFAADPPACARAKHIPLADAYRCYPELCPGWRDLPSARLPALARAFRTPGFAGFGLEGGAPGRRGREFPRKWAGSTERKACLSAGNARTARTERASARKSPEFHEKYIF